jgi:hypothetical protein
MALGVIRMIAGQKIFVGVLILRIWRISIGMALSR